MTALDRIVRFYGIGETIILAEFKAAEKLIKEYVDDTIAGIRARIS
jgi:hypothetical protein